MDPVELVREALLHALWMSAPVLLAGMVVALAIGILQALTQIQEQTVAFVPKLFAMILVLSLSLPWLIAQAVDYAREIITNIPSSL